MLLVEHPDGAKACRGTLTATAVKLAQTILVCIGGNNARTVGDLYAAKFVCHISHNANHMYRVFEEM
eukprot:6573597-Lingulodinium_polyedra.AAC.1